MLTIITDLGKRGVRFTSLAEPWANTDSPAAEFLLTCMAGVATFERARMKERQAEGIKIAKQKGVYKGGKRRFEPATIRQMQKDGVRPCDIARQLECSEATVHRALANGA
jgi:DNA invertase Pin-like site-specific DNA recombinase